MVTTACTDPPRPRFRFDAPRSFWRFLLTRGWWRCAAARLYAARWRTKAAPQGPAMTSSPFYNRRRRGCLLLDTRCEMRSFCGWRRAFIFACRCAGAACGDAPPCPHICARTGTGAPAQSLRCTRTAPGDSGRGLQSTSLPHFTQRTHLHLGCGPRQFHSVPVWASSASLSESEERV